jgi:hypothetical protein
MIGRGGGHGKIGSKKSIGREEIKVRVGSAVAGPSKAGRVSGCLFSKHYFFNYLVLKML